MRVIWKRFISLIIAIGLGVTAFALVAPADAASQVWAVASTPGLGPDTKVESVDCISSGWCVAVGGQRGGSSTKSLIAMGDGAQWSVVPSVDPLPISQLAGVACTSSDFCIAVGWGGLTVGTGENSIKQWDGTQWEDIPSPQVDLGHPPGFLEGQSLKAVSCVSESWCAAVGEYGNFNTSTISFSFLLWDGATWSLTAVPRVSGSQDRPADISCSSATSCVAVGTSRSGGRAAGVLWRWDGTTWMRDAMPDTGLPDTYLIGVSCPTPIWCSAVGIRAEGSVPGRTLNLVWDGEFWSMVSTPNVDDQYNYLKAISCVTAISCTAVGDHFGRIGEGGSQGYENLIMSWDGATWSVVPNVPIVDPTNLTPSTSYCEGLVCPSTSGSTFEEGTWFQEGSARSGAESVHVATGGWANRLYGVSCFSTSACRATGNAESGSESQAFVLVWNGELADYGPRFTG